MEAAITKNAGVAVLTSDKTGFKTKAITRDTPLLGIYLKKPKALV